ncbi:MAG: hypothetical protein CL946_07970 [Ectothiorhodospiraceae bacterium]|nr:hypothetical protein [Ectothiorhodospiraceae bacterium]
MKQGFFAKLVYPDPFKPAGVEFELPESADVTITVTDASGQVLAILLDGVRLEKGIHSVAAPPKSPAGEPAYIKLTAITKNDRIEIAKKLT